MTAPTPCEPIGPAEQAELAEVCEFLCDWFVTDPDPVEASLRRFSYGMFNLEEITSDLDRFARILKPVTAHRYRTQEDQQ